MDVRYWIYWNDLVQGPFTLDELIGLKAFDEDLMVCLEDRQDWMPAAQVAELLPELERVRIQQNRPPPPPPPPPPDRAPRETPLQGEFFNESPGQRSLFEKGPDKDSTPFAFAPAWTEMPLAEPTTPPTYTMPFRLGGWPSRSAPVLVIEAPIAPPTSTAVIEPPPVKPPVQDRPQIIDMPKIDFIPPTPVRESPLRRPIEEESTTLPEIPLRIFPNDLPIELPQKPRVKVAPVDDVSEPETFDWPREPLLRSDDDALPWLPWAIGILLILLFIGFGTYWLVDHFSSRAAIAEANKPLLPKPIAQVHLAAPEVVTDHRWDHQEDKAIKLVMNHKAGAQNIREQAQEMLKHFHQQEILHAGATGERLYLPDQLDWAAEPVGGALYKVHMNFSALKVDGSRVQSPSNDFNADLEHHGVEPGSAIGLGNFFTRATQSTIFPRDVAEAASMQAVLSAATTWNLEKAKSDAAAKNASESPAAKAAMEKATAAQTHFQRTLAHFRSGHSEQILQNLAKAYPFLQQALASGSDTAAASTTSDAWAHKEDQAVDTVKNATPKGGVTIAQHVEQLLQSMHEKELLYAAATGERQYPFDQVAWNATPAGGSLYNVHLDFSASGASGNAAAIKSDVFSTDLQSGKTTPADKATRDDFFKTPGVSAHKNALAAACAAVVGTAATTSATSVPTAFSDAVRDFRAHFSEQSLQNLAKAYPTVHDALAALTASTNATWSHQENQATATVQYFAAPVGQTIAQHTAAMLKAMRDKELVNAAETGQRSYQPDAVAWTATPMEGSTYQVRLDFSGVGADGNRITTKSNLFQADLQNGAVKPMDQATHDEFFKTSKSSAHKSSLAAAAAAVVDGASATATPGSSVSSTGSFAQAVQDFRAHFPEQDLQNLATAYPLVHQALAALAASVAPVAAAVPQTATASASAVVTPGLPVPSATSTTPAATPVTPGAAVAPTTPTVPTMDVWAGKESEAIKAVRNHKTGGAQTVDARAQLMLEEKHEKELLQAADTGERLYLPDQASWSALHEEGDVYRVYLNFSALQGAGDRVSTRMYQFRIHMSNLAIDSDDTPTLQDFLQTQVAYKHVHSIMADDIESILAGVDEINKLMLRTMIIKKSRHNKVEVQKTQDALTAAQLRLQKAMAYFRTRYPEKALTNIGQAYNFKVS